MTTNFISQEHTFDYFNNQKTLETIEKTWKFWALNRNWKPTSLEIINYYHTKEKWCHIVENLRKKKVVLSQIDGIDFFEKLIVWLLPKISKLS
jgi:hypothetical protein